MNTGIEKAEKITQKYADMIYRIALHNVKHIPDAEDILQEVCIDVLTKKIPEDEEHLKHWLIRVTINKCKSFHRSFWKKKVVSLDGESKLHITTENKDILSLVRTLPPDQRNVIYLYYYESYPIAEIAKILHKNPNTVGSMLQRARKKLKNILEEGE